MSDIVVGYWAGHQAVQIDLDNQAIAITYNSNTPPQPLTMSTVFAQNGKTYTQTFTYTAGNLVNASQWVTS
jgi:hypothetical protein